MSNKRHFVLTSVNIPKEDGMVVTPTCDCFSIRTKHQTAHPISMSSKCFLVFAGVYIPKGYSLVINAARKCISVGTEYLAIGAVHSKCFLVFTRVYIPEANAYISPTSKCFSIGAEQHTEYHLPYATERFDVLSCICIPETNNSSTAPTCDNVPISVERYTRDMFRMPSKCMFFVTCAGIPETDSAIATATRKCFSIRTEC